VEVELNPEQERELNIRLNKNSGEWDYDALANYFDVGELTEWGFTEDELQFWEDEPEEIIAENIDKDIGDIKILNLYAGIGGNRKLWGDIDVTAVEYNEEIAEAYSDFFPKDEVIVDDAHKYLEEHIDDGWDFIWTSPPCPTHSRLKIAGVAATRKGNTGCIKHEQKPVFPDMKLYEEILFLQAYFKGKWVVENVISWYDPLIEPQEIGRHYYWTNFDINSIDESTIEEHIPTYGEGTQNKKWGFDLTGYNFDSKYPKQKILNNMVHPKAGEYILKTAYA